MKGLALLFVAITLSYGQSIHSVGGAMDNKKTAKFEEEQLKVVDNSYRMIEYTSAKYYKQDRLLQALVALDKNYKETPEWLTLLLDFHLNQYKSVTSESGGIIVKFPSYEVGVCLQDVWTVTKYLSEIISKNKKASPYINKYTAILLDNPKLFGNALPVCLTNGETTTLDQSAYNIGGTTSNEKETEFEKNRLKIIDKQYRMAEYTQTEIYTNDSLFRALVALDKNYEETPKWLNILLDWHLSQYDNFGSIDKNITSNASRRVPNNLTNCLMNIWTIEEYVKSIIKAYYAQQYYLQTGKKLAYNTPEAHINKYTAILLDKPEFFEGLLPNCLKQEQGDKSKEYYESLYREKGVDYPDY
jgi:hypothetical protein